MILSEKPLLRRFFCLFWFLSWPMITFLLLKPLPFDLPSRTDLLGHVLLFGVMSLSVILFARSKPWIIALAVLTVLLSAILEVGQGFVPHRYFDISDMMANIVGAGGGCLLALWAFQRMISAAGQRAHV